MNKKELKRKLIESFIKDLKKIDDDVDMYLGSNAMFESYNKWEEKLKKIKEKLYLR